MKTFEEYMKEFGFVSENERMREAMRVTWDHALIEAARVAIKHDSTTEVYKEIHKGISR